MFCPVLTDDRVHSPAADTGRGGEDTAPRRGTPGHRGTRKMAEEKRTEGGGGRLRARPGGYRKQKSKFEDDDEATIANCPM